MKRLLDRCYIVTGAAGGIGRAIARRLIEEGASLVVSDLDASPLRAIVDELSIPETRLESVAGDASDPALGRCLSDRAERSFGRLDGCVACSGIIRITPVLDILPEQWDTVMSVNLRGTFFCLQAVAQSMKRFGRGGSIIALSSTSAHGPRPNNVDYGASKLGIDYVTRTLALELAAQQIRVNAISPGIVDTSMWRQVDAERGRSIGMAPGELSRKMVSEVPLSRLGMPEEVAALAAFLLSDESRYITGQIITIDGGFTLNHT